MLVDIQFESVFAGAIEATVAVDAMMLTATVGTNAFVGILTVSHCRVKVVANRAKRIVVAIILHFVIGSLLSQLTIAVPIETNSVLWQTPIGTDRIDATTLAAEFLPNRFLVQTFVNVDASLPVVVQHVALGANAERPPQRVEAGVRAAPIVDRAFIDVLAAVAVLREASSRQARTAAPVATPSVDTCILAGPVAVPQQTLVHIHALVIVCYSESLRAFAYKRSNRVGASILAYIFSVFDALIDINAPAVNHFESLETGANPRHVVILHKARLLAIMFLSA